MTHLPNLPLHLLQSKPAIAGFIFHFHLLFKSLLFSDFLYRLSLFNSAIVNSIAIDLSVVKLGEVRPEIAEHERS